jgi:hypothetical protein
MQQLLSQYNSIINEWVIKNKGTPIFQCDIQSSIERYFCEEMLNKRDIEINKSLMCFAISDHIRIRYENERLMNGTAHIRDLYTIHAMFYHNLHVEITGKHDEKNLRYRLELADYLRSLPFEAHGKEHIADEVVLDLFGQITNIIFNEDTGINKRCKFLIDLILDSISVNDQKNELEYLIEYAWDYINNTKCRKDELEAIRELIRMVEDKLASTSDQYDEEI